MHNDAYAWHSTEPPSFLNAPLERHSKGVKNSLAAIKSCRERRPDGEKVYVILDNLSAHRSKKIKAWCQKNNVELCFTPTYSSWANPIEAHFGPLREFVLNNSDHPDCTPS